MTRHRAMLRPRYGQFVSFLSCPTAGVMVASWRAYHARRCSADSLPARHQPRAGVPIVLVLVLRRRPRCVLSSTRTRTRTRTASLRTRTISSCFCFSSPQNFPSEESSCGLVCRVERVVPPANAALTTSWVRTVTAPCGDYIQLEMSKKSIIIWVDNDSR